VGTPASSELIKKLQVSQHPVELCVEMKIELLMFCFRDICLRLQSISLLATCLEVVEAVRLILVSINRGLESNPGLLKVVTLILELCGY